MNDRIPVTIISGSLGAGKTTLLNHLLSNADRRIAVLINDMGDVNVDASLIESGSDLAREGIAELSNGCICCELQDDLETEVRRLAGRYDFDHLVVESSGISEPAPVARLFTAGAAAARYTVDALVTVVDARLLDDTVAGRSLERETDPDETDRPLSDLLVEQIEVSNVVLLNKCDLIEEGTADRLEAVIAGLQPDAEVIRTEYSDVEIDRLLGREAFDPAELGELPGWKRALAEVHDHEHGDHDDHEHGDHDDHEHGDHDDHEHGDHDDHEHGDHDDHEHGDHDDHEHGDHDEHGHEHGDHCHVHRTPESVYGVSSVTYHRRQPLDPEGFAEVLRGLPSSIVRAKGPVWIAGRDDLLVQLSIAGRSIHAEGEGQWIVTLPPGQRSLYRDNHPEIPWDETHGDRRTDLVLIGTDFDADAIVDALDACLVDPDEAADPDDELFPRAVGERTVLRE